MDSIRRDRCACYRAVLNNMNIQLQASGGKCRNQLARIYDGIFRIESGAGKTFASDVRPEGADLGDGQRLGQDSNFRLSRGPSFEQREIVRRVSNIEAPALLVIDAMSGCCFEFANKRSIQPARLKR